MKRLVSYREFARIRGVNLYAVQKAIRDGRIRTTKGPDGKVAIDVDQAQADWEKNTDLSKAPKPELLGKAAKSPKPGTDPKRSIAKEPKVKKSKAITYAEARAIREDYQAKLARLDFEKRLGTVVDAEKIRVEAFQLARRVRDHILNIPNRIAPELAAETDPAKVHIKLTEHLTRALEELAKLELEAQTKAQEAEPVETS